ncbi:MAG: hypothetical protein OJF58_002619 [Enhydrobacter sp.]|jgi:hypothetical protein|nr:MAG: hypothetical protein OJF58_002619 [Enhydrobacter sp.]
MGVRTDHYKGFMAAMTRASVQVRCVTSITTLD